MLPRAAYARGLLSAPTSPLRFAFAFVPNGKWMEDWTPAVEGAEFALSPTLEPLAAFRRQLLVLTGLKQANAEAQRDGPGDHARSAACFLTGVHPKKTEGTDIKNGISIDQRLAEVIGASTRFPSIEVGCQPPLVSGGCDSGYSCAYSSNISWKSATTPQLKEVDPRALFERLFGAGDDLTPEQRARRLARKKSLLDYAQDDARRLTAQLGTTDRRKLDEYLTAVREIETRIQKAEADAQAQQPPPIARPAGIPTDHGEHARILGELVALAFQADLTRVATHMIANDGDNRSYPQLGAPEGHHESSHHGNDPVKIEHVRRIDRFHVEQLAAILTKFAATQDGDGTLLDHTLLTYGAGISDGNAHNHDHLPILMAGGGNATVSSGRHLRLAQPTPLCNLYLSLLDRTGARDASFGDSTGRVDLG
ncbi:MAG: DUF1552 domain-containing protein [Planctomycetes bacterium]|nr:DUF1552 domain-containing protein [Planctomycetota bacterium]